MNYAAPWWLPGGHLQTIWAARRAQRWVADAPSYRRERWTTPDDDFIDVDFAAHVSDPLAPLLVLFHGLEGSSASHYAHAFADMARSRGWAYAVPHFRGCSGEPNRAPRAYHSGDFAEVDWILRRFKAQHSGPVFAVGVSLGGNALMRWAAELRGMATQVVAAIASICAPLDLAASGWALGRGLNRQIYTRLFLDSLIPKALQKLEQYPLLFRRLELLSVRDLHAFDNVVTAPLHGFKNADDYWSRASAKPHLRNIEVPALAVNALNDPFIPAWSVPKRGEVSDSVMLWQPRAGGHVGFVSGTSVRQPTHLQVLPQVVGDFLDEPYPAGGMAWSADQTKPIQRLPNHYRYLRGAL